MSDNRVPPDKRFYLAASVFNTDGTLDFDCEVPKVSKDLTELTQQVADEIDQFGGEAYVYECRAVKRVVRGKTRVLDIKR